MLHQPCRPARPLLARERPGHPTPHDAREVGRGEPSHNPPPLPFPLTPVPLLPLASPSPRPAQPARARTAADIVKTAPVSPSLSPAAQVCRKWSTPPTSPTSVAISDLGAGLHINPDPNPNPNPNPDPSPNPNPNPHPHPHPPPAPSTRRRALPHAAAQPQEAARLHARHRR